MNESFDIVLPRAASPEEIRLALSSSVPSESLRVQASAVELTFEPNIFSATVDATADPLWPCAVFVWVCPSELGMGKHPELRVAFELCYALKCDALCGVQSFVEGIDPRDPYYSTAYVDGNWYLASTVGTPLMGPHTDGTKSFSGDASIRLVRLLNIPPGVADPTPNPSIKGTPRKRVAPYVER